MKKDIEEQQTELLLWVNRGPAEERSRRWSEAFFMLHRLWRHQWEDREREVAMIMRLRRWEPVGFAVLGAIVYGLFSWWF
jgi:hypothetical protein